MQARNQKLSLGGRGIFFNRGSELLLTTPQNTNFENSQHEARKI